MSTIVTPKLLLLDEHTAALDPKTAASVMDITQRIVKENHITTLMITHNMKPVSYTHLDVYKRQVLKRRISR